MTTTVDLTALARRVAEVWADADGLYPLRLPCPSRNERVAFMQCDKGVIYDLDGGRPCAECLGTQWVSETRLEKMLEALFRARGFIPFWGMLGDELTVTIYLVGKLPSSGNGATPIEALLRAMSAVSHPYTRRLAARSPWRRGRERSEETIRRGRGAETPMKKWFKVTGRYHQDFHADVEARTKQEACRKALALFEESLGSGFKPVDGVGFGPEDPELDETFDISWAKDATPEDPTYWSECHEATVYRQRDGKIKVEVFEP